MTTLSSLSKSNVSWEYWDVFKFDSKYEEEKCLFSERKYPLYGYFVEDHSVESTLTKNMVMDIKGASPVNPHGPCHGGLLCKKWTKKDVN